jgi:hypothetical protein
MQQNKVFTCSEEFGKEDATSLIAETFAIFLNQKYGKEVVQVKKENK